MHDAGTIVQRLIARYRRRIALRASAGMVAGLACAGLLALRLRQAGLPDGRIALFSGAVLALTAAWVWRSIQHGRSRRVSLVADLDRALGMDARLLTAVEFADAPEPPALYPRLLEETAKALPDVQRRLPSVIDRPGAVLAVAALLLLLWPHAGPRTQLAMTPPALMPPEVPPITPPEPPPQPQQNQQSQQQNQQPQPQQNQQNQQNQQQKNQSGGQQPQPQGGSQDKQQKQQQSGEQSKSQDQQGKGSQQSQQQSSEQSKQSGKDSKSGGGKDGQQADAEQLAKSDKTSASKAGANPGSPSDAAAQQALKADIQQLLKEMSSELKQMQAELEAKQSNSKEPSPLAGGATDPDLYEQSAKLDNASGSRLPMQLEVDTKPTVSPRRGSGTAPPAKQAADSLPQQEPENATLSDVRTTEQGRARAAIPPEYEPVFEKLSPGEQKQ